jgi:hypothetical protein
MRRWLLVAALSAAFAALPAYAQRGGGGHGGGFGGGHASMGGARAAGGFRGGFGRPGFGGPGFGGRPGFGFRGGPYFRGGFYGRGYPWWGWGYGYGYPWWGWDSGYDNSYYDNSYYSQPYYDNQAYYQGPSDSYLRQQQAEIDRLNDQVANLREEAERRSQPRSVSAAEPKPTDLVFRDNHTEEVQNYAITGQTLWILTEQRARKIPLSELDLAATRKMNEDRGVDFEIPR